MTSTLSVFPTQPLEEFENLLQFFYFGMHNDYRPTVTDWISILSISTRLIFPKVRERATKELTARMEEIDPFDLIGLAIKYDVLRWLDPAYLRIVRRTDLITQEEAQKIPLPIVVMLMRSHERNVLLTKDGDRCSTMYSRCILLGEVKLMEKSYLYTT
ncbi:hypothetical protein H4582DRAFT_1024950 [Lactarius indigo]|nr:hypothetical protein H4582DRAFT_1024950 [Lactarius indigo]